MENNTNSQPAVEVRGLTKRVMSGSMPLTILHEIDLAVGAGESVAVLGASGSGKSTLLGLIAGLDTPSSGSIVIDGRSLFELSEDQRAEWRGRQVGFVFQSFHLLPQLTALENVMLPLELRGDADPQPKAAALLTRVGLGERLAHYPKHLSGGEQQRVAIARAFATQPRLLLADEPTGNLDVATGAGVIDLIFELNAQQGATVILVTHDPALAARCSRRIQLVAGRIGG